MLHVVMPEHVELLLSEPQHDTSSDRTAPLKPTSGLNGPPVFYNKNPLLACYWSECLGWPRRVMSSPNMGP